MDIKLHDFGSYQERVFFWSEVYLYMYIHEGYEICIVFVRSERMIPLLVWRELKYIIC